MSVSTRRDLLRTACTLPLLGAAIAHRPSATSSSSAWASARPDLTPITGAAEPISSAERRARIAKVQGLMRQRRVDALLIEPGASLDYFTGIRWNRSERTTAAILPAAGELMVVTPAFEEPSVRETLQVGGDVRPWNEHESPFERIVEGLRDRGVASGVLAVEPTVRFFVVDGIRQVSNAYDLVSAEPLIRACRMIKSPAELALMQTANDVTIAALRYVHAHVERGMNAADLASIIDAATTALGGAPNPL